jgi:hypothetical protein
MPIFLKVNHRLESRMPEIGQSGSEGGAKLHFVPTPILRRYKLQATGAAIIAGRSSGPQRGVYYLREMHPA